MSPILLRCCVLWLLLTSQIQAVDPALQAQIDGASWPEHLDSLVGRYGELDQASRELLIDQLYGLEMAGAVPLLERLLRQASKPEWLMIVSGLRESPHAKAHDLLASSWTTWTAQQQLDYLNQDDDYLEPDVLRGHAGMRSIYRKLMQGDDVQRAVLAAIALLQIGTQAEQVAAGAFLTKHEVPVEPFWLDLAEIRAHNGDKRGFTELCERIESTSDEISNNARIDAAFALLKAADKGIALDAATKASLLRVVERDGIYGAADFAVMALAASGDKSLYDALLKLFPDASCSGEIFKALVQLDSKRAIADFKRILSTGAPGSSELLTYGNELPQLHAELAQLLEEKVPTAQALSSRERSEALLKLMNLRWPDFRHTLTQRKACSAFLLQHMEHPDPHIAKEAMRLFSWHGHEAFPKPQQQQITAWLQSDIAQERMDGIGIATKKWQQFSAELRRFVGRKLSSPHDFWIMQAACEGAGALPIPELLSHIQTFRPDQGGDRGQMYKILFSKHPQAAEAVGMIVHADDDENRKATIGPLRVAARWGNKQTLQRLSMHAKVDPDIARIVSQGLAQRDSIPDNMQFRLSWLFDAVDHPGADIPNLLHVIAKHQIRKSRFRRTSLLDRAQRQMARAMLPKHFTFPAGNWQQIRDDLIILRARWKDEPLVSDILPHLSASDSPTRRSACATAQMFASKSPDQQEPELRTALWHLAENDHPENSREALRALQTWPHPEDLPRLIKLIHHYADSQVRLQAIDTAFSADPQAASRFVIEHQDLLHCWELFGSQEPPVWYWHRNTEACQQHALTLLATDSALSDVIQLYESSGDMRIRSVLTTRMKQANPLDQYRIQQALLHHEEPQAP